MRSGFAAGRSSSIRQATGRRRLPAVRKAEGVRPTSDALLPCLTAIPQHFSLSDGWSSGWKTNNPACGYPRCSMGCLGGRSIGPSQHTPPFTEPYDGGTHRIQARLPSVDVPLGTPLYRLRQTSRNIRFGYTQGSQPIRAKPTIRTPFDRHSGEGWPPRGAESVGCPEILRKIMAHCRSGRHVRRRAGVFCAMNRGPIPGINIVPNTASTGYRRGETARSAQICRTPDIAPNTLP